MSVSVSVTISISVVYANRLTCRPDAFFGSVFVVAVSKFWSTTCIFPEFLSISSPLCLFRSPFALILLALRFCSFRDRNSRFCCVGPFRLHFDGLFAVFLCCLCPFADFRRFGEHSAEHPCANHDNVQIRLHPFPQSSHGPTMLMSTQTPSDHAEHPWTSHDNVHSNPIRSHKASMGQPCSRPLKPHPSTQLRALRSVPCALVVCGAFVPQTVFQACKDACSA